MERIGTKLIDLLGTKDPWGKMPCSRTNCWPCKDEKSAGCCRFEGITYSIVCLGCQAVVIKSEYSGESSRSMYQRGQEHLKDLADQKDDSPLWKHCASMHNGVTQEFQMKLVVRHRSALNRQIS